MGKCPGCPVTTYNILEFHSWTSVEYWKTSKYGEKGHAVRSRDHKSLQCAGTWPSTPEACSTLFRNLRGRNGLWLWWQNIRHWGYSNARERQSMALRWCIAFLSHISLWKTKWCNGLFMTTLRAKCGGTSKLWDTHLAKATWWLPLPSQHFTYCRRRQSFCNARNVLG